MCSPLWWRPLYRFHSSGRCTFGSHWPNSSRKLNTRSLARAFSSSRRAPPNAASNLFSRIARSSVTVCSGLRDGIVSTTRPASMSSCTLATISRTPASCDELVAGLQHLVEVVPGVDMHHRERQAARPERLERQMQHDDGVLAAGEQQHRPLELRGHLPNDVDGLGLQRAQMAQLVAACLVELLGGGHRILVKLVEMTRFICITRYETSAGLRCQRTP